MIFLMLNQAAIILAPEGGWLNVPGLEIWRFINLAIFIAALVYILKSPLSEAFKTRREGIRRDLIRAKEERDAALAKLAEVEKRLESLGGEVALIKSEAERDAAEERERIALATAEEMKRLREQARREIETAGKAARYELRRFAAEKSVQMAEDVLRRDLRPEDDARLIRGYVQELGGLKR